MDVKKDSPVQSGRLEVESETLFNVDLLRTCDISRSDGIGWGATPLNAYASPEIRVLQAAVMSELLERVSLPPEGYSVPEGIQQYLIANFYARHTSRTMANFDNYSQRIAFAFVPTETQQTVIDRGIAGQASPAELAYIRNVLEFGSVELGCLTHPYGKNIELLDQMRQAVTDTIQLFDGEVFEGEDAEPIYKVKQIDGIMYHRNTEKPAYLRNPATTARDARKLNRRQNGELLDGLLHVHDALLMTRKRDIGVLGDGSVVRERSSFILRIDAESGFDQCLAEQMRQVTLGQDKESLQELMNVGGLDKLIPELLANNDFRRVVPNSTTIYAYNRASQKKIDDMHDDQNRVREDQRAKRLIGNTAISR